MTASTPGVLISRDGTVREYVGHSNKNGTVFGVVRRQGKGNVWQAVCAGCKTIWLDSGRGEVARSLRGHWENADSQMTATHQRKVVSA